MGHENSFSVSIQKSPVDFLILPVFLQVKNNFVVFQNKDPGMKPPASCDS